MLSLSNLPKLKCLECFLNSLSTLYVNALTSLEYLDCCDNPLTSLNVAGLSQLKTIDVKSNKGMNAAALNTLFGSLNSTTTIGEKRIDVNTNPGADTCNAEIAINKKWKTDVPYISQQPVGKDVIEGTSVSFDIAASAGGWPLKYEWQVLETTANAAWKPIGTDSNRLTINTTKSVHNYKYRCVVKNYQGTAVYTAKTSNIVTLAIKTAPKIDTQPQSQNINVGGNATFTVAASGNPAPAQYKWYFCTRNGGAWSAVPNVAPYSGANTKTLTITNVAAAINDSSYRCEVANSIGTTASNPATLTVIAVKPIVAKQPLPTTVNSGTNATFTVESTGGKPAPDHTWQVCKSGTTYNNVSGSEYSGATANGANNSTLTIIAPTTAMNGYKYRCLVQNAAGSFTSNVVVLTVNAVKPAITKSDFPKDVETGVNDKAKFTVEATGDPHPTYQWQAFGENFGENKQWNDIVSGPPYKGEKTKELVIDNALKDMDGYKYRCNVSNTVNGKVETVSSRAAVLTVTVVDEKPFIKSHPEKVEAKMGESVTFKVEAGGIPKPTIFQWEFSVNGKNWTKLKSNSPYKNVDTDTLTIKNATPYLHGYQYRCIVKNTLKQSATSKSARLEVRTLSSEDAYQQAQIDLYTKLTNINLVLPFPSYEELKQRVQDKKLTVNERILKEELLVAKDYFEDIKEYGANSKTFVEKWNEESPLHDFIGWFHLDVIEKLLQLFEKQLEVSSSLIPIKGISKIMQAKLRNFAIYDIGGLLNRGKTINKRNQLAAALDVDPKLVNAWVKQADLWRVEGMTTDTAYMLVQLGVRNPEDLSKIDSYKAYPILKSLALAQPDFQLMEETQFEELIQEAKETIIHACINQDEFSRRLIDKMKDGKTLTPEDIDKLFNQSRNPSLLSSTVETYDREPSHLFRKDFLPVATKTSGKIIRDGLAFLDEVPLVLPLPYAISGKIWKSTNKGYPNLLVEISGISSSATDKTENMKKPSTHTDSSGFFRVILPEKLNLQEGIIFTISQPKTPYKQVFMKCASDIIDAVPQQKYLQKFYELQAIAMEISYKETRGLRLAELKYDLDILNDEIGDIKNKMENLVEENGYTFDITHYRQQLATLTEKYCNVEREYKDLKKIIEEDEVNNVTIELEEEYNQLRAGIITESNPRSTDLEIILRNLVSSDNKYSANLEDPFLIVQDIFTGRDSGLDKALPSVKLMGEGETAIHLPTDMAPSRVFNYVMLQRLVEPALGFIPEEGSNMNDDGRRKLMAPVDVMNFKEKMYKNPDSQPQMYSLGIGYMLDMHQAWVPDGFALGTLLYSLILAPGEEQRLIIRENKQSYTVKDDLQGADSDSQTYELSQIDDTTAAYDYALGQLSKGDSSYEYETKASTYGGGIGGAGGLAGIFGLSGGFSGSTSKTRGSGSASASQSNAHNEASSTAQNFQHGIKSASDRISQAKRISVRTATSEESNSVATKIIANHNHSHAMTIQYWEVMRRFRLETCIDGVELVLFVPLRVIKFLHDGNYQIPKPTSFDKAAFNERYKVVLQYVDNLRNALPARYLAGLNLIQKYAAYPNWKLENTEVAMPTLTLEFKCNFLEFDDVTATLVLKNGKGAIAGNLNYTRSEITRDYHETSAELKKAIKNGRNEMETDGIQITKTKRKDIPTATCTFTLPPGIVDDDLAYIKIEHSCEDFQYDLLKNPYEKIITGKANASSPFGPYDSSRSKNADAIYRDMMGKMWDSVKDRKDTAADLRKVEHYKQLLPEAYLNPTVKLSPSELKALGNPIVSDVKLTGNSNLSAIPSSSTINSNLYINLAIGCKTMLYSELQTIESTIQHIASDTLHYSKVIWGALSDDELAMMLEQYTIDMDFEDMQNFDDDEDELNNSDNKNTQTTGIDIPLLNCVNVKKMLGFYGNCILLPFTYPKALAKKLGKTAAEVQDALYRYHTHCFRVPTTTISLPTDGMIGEAVLGETNVSELIDLTRFWNWKDSPIDNMELNKDYLNSTDYLGDKAPGQITALNLQGATAATPVTVPDLVSALVAKQTPTFNDITGLDQLKEVLNKATESAAQGRDKALDSSAQMAQTAVEVMKAQGEIDDKKAKAELEKTKVDKGIKDKEEKEEKDKDKAAKDKEANKEFTTIEKQLKESEEKKQILEKRIQLLENKNEMSSLGERVAALEAAQPPTEPKPETPTE